VEQNNNLLSKLKTLVNNKRQWDAFNNYLDWIIVQQQSGLEQNIDVVSIYRAQGSISTLRKLKQLRDEVNAHG
jgi:uncharacterized protein YcbK (DUF882 family)